MSTSTTTYETIVIGGSFAGLSAALQIARSCRKVLVIDSSENRNRFAQHAHGFLGHDGKSPSDILTESKAQLRRYSDCTIVENVRVVSIQNLTAEKGASPSFNVVTSDEKTLHTRRIILATGLKDNLPPVEGLQESWGKSVFHCPYCHGYEFRGKPLGLLYTTPIQSHQARLLPDLTKDIILFTGGAINGTESVFPAVQLSTEETALWEKLGIKLEHTPVSKFVRDSNAESELSYVELSDGRKIERRGVLLLPPLTLSTPNLVADLGCDVTPSPFGVDLIKVDPATQVTSIPGVYAAGDSVRPMNVAVAVADGSIAGIMCHQSLVAEDIKKIQ
ncbi:FAD-dependent pyridine nucleotide-disulfide oxidoreductase [Spizellomyces punctatus DAOM BR117]|uniref:FAD-dependent pyridine nucleotide-disulfide oxidoreductase n=1 Tax=Spizellomyces punctatus (strain DAOM BR117) TaxID=645134 RepID=A0A0L0HA92_SPIPD|nr:FAD-dependent pyridine nucleotide-disulfide oxidoreductase [Spizellomyces punctatus DAOM BR117]KNC97588.1 FAD-dependent pyridine nucleotide-disulfide oxidoreductase [Spizellomyces punctatus DAOM BR117]|eukprot:XP_016605628.1 FAD-dependent pyridine nucleotide-disulfide oxidoreductase [Spizellomyces punctatus DAOM BR117]